MHYITYNIGAQLQLKEKGRKLTKMAAERNTTRLKKMADERHTQYLSVAAYFIQFPS